jgi:hypothetical protein
VSDLQPIADRFEIPVRSLSRQPGAGMNRVQAMRAGWLVPSAAFLSTGATRPGFGPACFGVFVCFCVLIDLSAGVPSWVVKRVTQPVRNREAQVTGPHLA